MFKYTTLFLAVGFVTSATASQIALAQKDHSSNRVLEEIMVTAQKRAESLQSTPVTVTALGQQEIERRQVVEIGDLQGLAPGVSFGQHSGFSRLFIRGIGLTSISPSQDPSVALQVDGVVIGRPFAQLSALYDLERIEILRGPQGTLYGRNATGGSVNVITRKPTEELEGYIDVTFGNYDHRQLDAAISGPLNSAGSVRGRLALQRVRHEGYGKNRFLDEDIGSRDSTAVRAILDFEPSDGIDVSITADYAEEDDSNYAFTGFGGYRDDTPLLGLLLGGDTLVGSRDVLSDVSQSNDRELYGASLTIGYDLSDKLRLQSITGYRNSERHNVYDPDTTSGAAFSATVRTEASEQWSEELQLHYSSQNITGVVGLFYYREDIEAELDLLALGVGGFFGFPEARFHELGQLEAEAYAVFTQWSYQLADDLRITGGLRYSDEKRDSVGQFTIFNLQPPPNGANVTTPIDTSDNWSAVTPRIGLDYFVTSDVMLYASATRGFKSGVVAIGNLNPPVDPEYIWSYEAGVKSTLLDGVMEVNAAIFHYDYKDLQVNRVINNSIETVNAASATVNGFEVELRAQPTANLYLSADMTFLDAQFDEFDTDHPARPEAGTFDLSGNQLENAPRWMANLSAAYDIPIDISGTLSLRTDVKWSDDVYFTEFNEDILSQDAVAIVDASLRYEDASGLWRATLFAKNLTDEDVVTSQYISGPATGYAIQGGWKPPRTFGVKLGYQF